MAGVVVSFAWLRWFRSSKVAPLREGMAGVQAKDL